MSDPCQACARLPFSNVIALVLAAACMTALVTAELCCQRLHDEAVKLGKAEYYLDDNHKARWRWKP